MDGKEGKDEEDDSRSNHCMFVSEQTYARTHTHTHDTNLQT